MRLRGFASLAPLVMLAAPAGFALPTMIRLGYPNCISCHVSPQGGGLLNLYGRGIDLAQSLKGGEYQPNESMFGLPGFGGRFNQDIRAAFSTQLSSTTGGPLLGTSRGRYFFRNVTTLGKGFRASVMIDGDPQLSLRKTKPYEAAVNPGQFLVNQAMLQFRPREGIEFGVGRDMLPQGLIIPDQSAFIKARNRLGYYDVPTQAKAFFWGKRWLVSPYAFAPSGMEAKTMRESGGGFMAEYDLLGKGKTVFGFNGLRGHDGIGNRTMSGVYTRLGFGAWGVLGEHDFTQRRLHPGTAGSLGFGQNASYLQVFRYFREWLIASAIVERLGVANPYPERLWAYKGEVGARLSNQVTVSFRAGVQRDFRSGALSPVAGISLAVKTVQ